MFKCSSTDASDLFPAITSGNHSSSRQRRHSTAAAAGGCSISTTTTTKSSSTINNNTTPQEPPTQQQPSSPTSPSSVLLPRRGMSLFKQNQEEAQRKFSSPSTFSPDLESRGIRPSPSTGCGSPNNESFLNFHPSNRRESTYSNHRWSNASAGDDKPSSAETIGILMLGSGGSGKTSLFKQRKLIYEGGFSGE